MPDLENKTSGPFWQAAADGRLDLCWCARCDRAVWYPEQRCPACLSDTCWRTLSGLATLLSWTVVHMPINPDFETPYIPALVLPEEAPEVRIVTQLVDCDPVQLRCDMALEACFRQIRTKNGDSYQAPLFRPRA